MSHTETVLPSTGLLASAPVGGFRKRIFDVVCSLGFIVILSPVLLAIALAVRLFDNGSALYAHPRVGLGGKPFPCLKFRSMVPNAEEVLERHLANDEDAAQEWRETQKLRDDPRVTPIGKLLRRTSLDELPQLLNVLRGEMSLVGPRPITEKEVARYGPSIEKYYRARPGLTGAWQISGRNDVSYDDRVGLDCDYVENCSIPRDVLIILKTVPAVLASRGCY